MSRYDELFARLGAANEAAMIPFLMLGDPDPAVFLEHVDAVVAAGADALELGVPFSDPVADGPIMVAASRRALASGTGLPRCLELLAAIRARYPMLPLGVLVYVNVIFAAGIEAFCAKLADAGVDSVLVPDLPLREASPFRAAAGAYGIEQVFILPPNAGENTLRRIAAAARGYTYVLGRSGVTGTDREMTAPLPERLRALREAGGPPPVVGFGISSAAHVTAAVRAGARGVIAGSALVQTAAGGGDLHAAVSTLKAATRGQV